MAFRTPNPYAIATRQLIDSRITLLEAYMELEAAQARVNALVARINRLDSYLKTQTGKETQE